jgi:hypothetical protein
MSQPPGPTSPVPDHDTGHDTGHDTIHEIDPDVVTAAPAGASGAVDPSPTADDPAGTTPDPDEHPTTAPAAESSTTTPDPDEHPATGAATDLPAQTPPLTEAQPVPAESTDRPSPVGADLAAPTPASLAGRPAPRPGPPGPRPPAEPSVGTAGRPVSAGAQAAAAFGRVGEDGTVYVRLADRTELVVGQWAAGESADGLAFFARKYDDLAVEVDLATRRLGEGKAAPEQAAAVVKRARESLDSPAMVGDLAALQDRVTALDELVTQRREAVSAAKSAAKAQALAAREAIVAEAESLAESTQWKATGERFKNMLDQWRSTPRADRGVEQELWKRFSHARSVFDKRRRQYFAKLDSERSEAKQVKEAIVREAEGLRDAKDWAATAAAFRDLMARWKTAGRAGKSDEERLWERFRAAQDAFFTARNDAMQTRDAGQKENLAAKLALLAEAEAIDTSDLRAAKVKLRSVQERWEAVGHVPRADKERIEARLRRVEETLRRGDQEQWRRTNPEARARAEATTEQFQGQLDRLRTQLADAQAAGDERRSDELRTRIESTEALLQAARSAAAEFGS